MRTPSFVAAAIVLVSSVYLVGRQGPLSSRPVGLWRGREAKAFVPFSSGSAFEAALLTLVESSGVPIGLERVIDEPLPPNVLRLPHASRSITLTGQRLGDALAAIITGAPPYSPTAPAPGYTYTWHEADGLVHVTPLSTRPTFLDTTVTEFELNGEPVGVAMFKIHRLFDPSYPDLTVPGRKSITLGSPPSDSAEEQAARATMRRPLSLSLKNVTVRQILDSVANSNGSVSWIVRCRTIDATYARSEIAFASLAGLVQVMPTHLSK
jgi:hypothetical protein